jgi:hypothetical protein
LKINLNSYNCLHQYSHYAIKSEDSNMLLYQIICRLHNKFQSFLSIIGIINHKFYRHDIDKWGLTSDESVFDDKLGCLFILSYLRHVFTCFHQYSHYVIELVDSTMLFYQSKGKLCNALQSFLSIIMIINW